MPGVTGVIGDILKNHKMTAANVGMSLYFGADQYQEERQAGSSAPIAAGKAIVDNTLPLLMGLPQYLGYEAITHMPELAMQGVDAYNRYSRELGQQQRRQTFNTARFNDTEQYYTMRQAGMAIAQRSRYNTRQAMLGNEAKYMMK